MENKANYAIDNFDCGFNCSQAVFSAFCEELGLNKKIALKIACSFGGGMALGEVCGAVTGAFLVLGLKYGNNDPEDKFSKAKNRLLNRDFTARFRKLHGYITCKELLNYDITDDKQLNAARQSGIFKTKCPNYVRDTVLLLEEIIAENT
ncbi:C-GCAxxG-C-C family protein [Pseudobacteroides cellulosolvens]|uniref:C_GCAxxG_C_C family protein n=1 Tax=Pseudobacteroides cellulosolvens ATCC 35603 = DSM 2933 TaxID=398512 RepID=A0A0L6JXX5_9FIRM|nr:C-GCAxxG-C-C family protein [Pseudobacteroides cellulosolvens]KNY30302.1 C_GCAxxG_C_C family protein [Pseudobacteroides cellulosolvens ATCC 35603 = DSM 2933]